MGKVVLREQRDRDGARYLSARLTEDGALVVEGQDLGPGVTRVFGEGITEYEWTHTVAARHVPTLVAALAGAEGSDVLALLASGAAGPFGEELPRILAEHRIPYEVWSRLGD
ncbi:hypothetical protein GR925_22855 [Streptomyces sp. HUCO-GS316]|uniref:hypothetical protein n=1 Tax=Streptomyces sp. HUCO-GS316 TaxID=2692198 RepID=UPI00136D037D|nr:hypothetical protein [Streptomyces sp. HUCO-GS316]MXM66197.1 hypothetical protein [Streptomyces sp. HUCO-GS316]